MTAVSIKYKRQSFWWKESGEKNRYYLTVSRLKNGKFCFIKNKMSALLPRFMHDVTVFVYINQ